MCNFLFVLIPTKFQFMCSHTPTHSHFRTLFEHEKMDNAQSANLLIGDESLTFHANEEKKVLRVSVEITFSVKGDLLDPADLHTVFQLIRNKLISGFQAHESKIHYKIKQEAVQKMADIYCLNTPTSWKIMKDNHKIEISIALYMTFDADQDISK